MAIELRVGDQVMVYEDPITRLKEEGKAEVVEITDIDEEFSLDSILFTCRVRFLPSELGDDTFARRILFDRLI